LTSSTEGVGFVAVTGLKYSTLNEAYDASNLVVSMYNLAIVASITSLNKIWAYPDSLISTLMMSPNL
jgi:hypothetical protein